MTKTLDRLMPKIALPIIIVAGTLLLFFLFVSAKNTGEQNNAYIRVINCIVSYNVDTRTQEQIENCYTTVERDLDTRLQRYDASN